MSVRLNSLSKVNTIDNGMSTVQFAESSASKPSIQELSAFANRSQEIDVGGDIVDLGDDLGINLLANQNRVAQSPRTATRQVSFSSGQTQPQMSSPGTSEIQQIQLKSMDDLEVVNLDAGAGISDIRINHEEMPYVIRSDNPSQAQSQSQAADNQETENQEKQKYLTKLRRLESQDIRGQRMTMQNSLDDIKAEYDKLVDSRNLESSIRFQRNALMTFVTGIEMVNDKVGHRLPVKPRLKGWSESVHTNVEDFDEIFEELYDMYKDKAKMHPLMRLAGTLGVSATMFHLTNSMAERSGIPHMADILNENPELQRQFAQTMAAKMGGGMGNFMSAAMASPSPPQYTSSSSSTPGMDPTVYMSPPAPSSGRTPFNMASSAGPIPINSAATAAAASVASAIPTARREMRGPTGVDDILKAFENERMNDANNVPIFTKDESIFTPSGPPPTPSRSNMRAGVGTYKDPMAEFLESADDIHSVASGSTMNTERRRGRKRMIVPPIGATLDLNV